MYSHDDDLENQKNLPPSFTGAITNGMEGEEEEEEETEGRGTCNSVLNRQLEDICHDIEDVLCVSKLIYSILPQGILPWI